jgi:hypothetical protein
MEKEIFRASQQTNFPTQKVAAGGIAGVLSFVVVLVLNGYVPFFIAHPVTGELASGLTMLISILVAYFTPHSQNEAIISTVDGMKAAVKA